MSVIPFEKSFASNSKSQYWSIKNELKPENVLKSSGKKYWFNCEKCSHTFDKSLDSISGKNSWCPYCSKPPKKLCDNENCIECFNKSFLSHEKSKFWSIKNKLNPRQIFKNSNNKYLFNCVCNHENEISLNNINAGNWCSYCSIPQQKLCGNNECNSCFDKSFKSHIKSKYWSNLNIDKNGIFINPIQIFKKTDTLKYKLFCDVCNHVFERFPANIQDIENMTHCIYCVIPTHILCNNENCNYCFERSFASHEKSKYWSIKNELKPRELIKGNNNKFWFNCIVCNHNFNTSLSHITEGNWCPYCCIPQKKLCGNTGCNSCFEQSAASNERLVSCWSNTNKLNINFIFKMGDTKIDLNCDICSHSFKKRIADITKGGWCPYCCNPPKKLCNKDIECIECFNKSFASNEKSKYWNYNKNILMPREVFKSNNNKFWFNCDNCYHSFDKSLNSISGGGWCHYCSSYKMCNKDIECNDCFNKSFASFEKSKYWDFNKNELIPREVFKNNNNKFWFNCINKHSFNSSLSHITHGKWCPYCVNKTEQKLYDLLIIKYPTLKTQFKVEWCKNITYLPFDFVLEEHKIIIELDGRQHFEQVNNWSSPEKTHQNDIYKMKCANDFGFSIIRILQEDVFYNTYEWFNELTNHIDTIISQPQIQNIFMCKNNEYHIFNL